ncbi:hypothetical protein Tco_0734278 [Tanacetum coccineum]
MLGILFKGLFLSSFKVVITVISLFQLEVSRLEVEGSKTCEDNAKRRNSGAKTKTFEENCYLLLYVISSKEDMAFKELLMKCPQHYLTDMQEVILFYNGLDVPTRQVLDSKGAIPSKTAADAKIAIQEMAEYS